jgi:hypothetical protein
MMVRRGSAPEMKATRKGAAEILTLHVPHEGMRIPPAQSPPLGIP